jgi:hypothetical protein
MSRYLKYLLGQPVSFDIASRTSPQQVSDRLKSKVRSRLWPFHFEKVVGRVGAESLSVEWRGSAFNSNMAPRLTGRLVFAAGGTRFDGRFGAPLFMRFFLIIWLCFDGMFFLAMLSDNIRGGGAPWFVFPFLVVHLLFPFGLVAIGMVGADTVRQRLINFVVEVGSGTNRRD